MSTTDRWFNFDKTQKTKKPKNQKKNTQAGRWTVDAAPPEVQHPALLSQLRLEHLVPLNRGKLWGFAKSSLLEFLVASRVKRDVLEEGRRRRSGGGGGRSRSNAGGDLEGGIDAGVEREEKEGEGTGCHTMCVVAAWFFGVWRCFHVLVVFSRFFRTLSACVFGNTQPEGADVRIDFAGGMYVVLVV